MGLAIPSVILAHSSSLNQACQKVPKMEGWNPSNKVEIYLAISFLQQYSPSQLRKFLFMERMLLFISIQERVAYFMQNCHERFDVCFSGLSVCI